MKNIKKVLFAGALALGAQVNAQTNESSSVGIQTQDVVSSTKQKVQAVNTNTVVYDQAGNAFIEVGTQDALQYAINFATNPNSAFDLGDEASYKSNELTKMKKVPGVKITKGKVEYSPVRTLENLKSKKTVYSSDMEKMFAGNSYLLQHFQFFLNSKLGLSQKEFSGKFDAETLTKLSSVLKNESIFSSFDKVLATYGSQGLNVFNLNGKTVVVYTDLQDFSDKDAIAILDMPYFDEKGEVQFVNDFNKEISLVGLHSLKNFAFVPGLDDNQMRSVLKNWTQSVMNNVETIKKTHISPLDLQAKADKKSSQNDVKIEEKLLKERNTNQNGPTILGGNGEILSGNIASNSGMGVMFKRNALGLSHQDEIALDKVNVKATLEFIAEATNMGDNSRVAAKLIMLYSMARVGTTLYLEKGDMTTKAGVGVSYKTDAGDVIKLDYGFFKQFLEYTFPEVNAKRKLAPEQHGVSLSYTQKDIEKFELLKEMTYTLRAFQVESLDVGEVGKITKDVNNVFEQWKAMGALQGGKKIETEVNFAFDLSKYIADELSMTNFRLDIAPRIGITKTDDVLDIKGTTTMGTGLKTKLTALLFDDTLKASLYSDIYTGGIYSVGLELSKKLPVGEATFYAKQDSYGKNVQAMNSVGVKGTFNNPFGLQDDENNQTSKFSPLFNQNQNISKFLTYEEADIDQKLFSGYAIKPNPVIQKIREIRIDRSALPAGSTLDKNYDGTLKQVNLATGVNNLDGSISVNPAAFASHFSVTGNSFITVKNIEKMDVPATYNIVAGQTGGTSVIMSLVLTKGSVMIDQTVDFLVNVPNNLAQDYFNKIKTIDEIRAIMSGNNNPPVPTFTAFSMNEDSVYNGTLTATDAESNPLTFTKISDPSHGTVIINSNGTFTYTPTANHFGFDSFNFSVSDGVNPAVNQTVNITINDVPEDVLPTSSFASGSVTKLTSDGIFTNTFSTNSPGVVTYSSSNTAVATVDSSTGAVTIVGAGTVTITANQASATGFTTDSDTYTLTVNTPTNVPGTIASPTLDSKTTTTINSTPGAVTGMSNVRVALYTDVGLTNKIGENSTGDFSGLTSGTTYYLVTVGDDVNESTGLTETKQSTTLTVTTEAPPLVGYTLLASPDGQTFNNDNVVNEDYISFTTYHDEDTNIYVDGLLLGQQLPGVSETRQVPLAGLTHGPKTYSIVAQSRTTGQYSPAVTFTINIDRIAESSDTTLNSRIEGDGTGTAYFNEPINTLEPVKVVTGVTTPEMTIPTTSVYATTVPIMGNTPVAGTIIRTIEVEDQAGNRTTIQLTRVVSEYF